MARLALALFILYLALAVGARMALQKRRTGSSGFRGISGRPGSVEWFGRLLFACVLGPGLAAPVLDLAGVVEPVAALDGRAGHAAGIVLYGLGLAGTLDAQSAMGRSWRIGVEEFDGEGIQLWLDYELEALRTEVRGSTKKAGARAPASAHAGLRLR